MCLLGSLRTVVLRTVLVPALDPGLLVVVPGLPHRNATGRTGLTDQLGLTVNVQTGLQCLLPHRLVVWTL